MGKKTSVYLSAEQAEILSAAGMSTAQALAIGVEAVRTGARVVSVITGLEARVPEAGKTVPVPRKRTVVSPEAAAEVEDAWAAVLSPPCPHPKARVLKGFCNACGKPVKP